MCDIIRRLAVALRPWRGRLQPILLLDCAKQHLHWRVAAQAARSEIWLAYIPANLTWLLQPCDTHVFAVYKAFMTTQYIELSASSPTGEVSEEDWLRLVGRGVRTILQGRRWSHAFVQNGFGRATEIRDEVRAELGPEAVPAVGDGRPSGEDLRLVFPGRCNAHAVLPRHLWRPFESVSASPPKAAGGRGRVWGPPLAAPLAPPPGDHDAERGVQLRPCPAPSPRARAAAAAVGPGLAAGRGRGRIAPVVKATAAMRAKACPQPKFASAGSGAPSRSSAG